MMRAAKVGGAIRVGVALAAAVSVSGGARADDDAARGAKLFERYCTICHYAPEQDRNWIGPSLHGAFGRAAAQVPTYYAYSKALKESKLVWDEPTLDNWLRRPEFTLPGTKMNFPGIADSKDRADIIAYLKASAQ